MDVLLWSVRAVLIAVGIILVLMIVKRRREGRFWEQYYLSFLVIGITAFILGVILLIVSSTKDLSFNSGLYITVVGVIAFIVGLVIRNIWNKSR